MITFAQEAWPDVEDEFHALLTQFHAPEASVFQDKMTVTIDYDEYRERERLGQLLTITAREGLRHPVPGRLVGYHVTLIAPNPHFVGVNTAWIRQYFVHPDCRNLGVGRELHRIAEIWLKKRGVQCLHSGVKNHLDAPRHLYDSMGWTATETLYMKWLE